MTKQDKPAVQGQGAYLGGHPSETGQVYGRLEMNATAVYVFDYHLRPSRRAVTPWAQVQSVSMELYSQAKSRLGPVLVFGLFGLAAKGTAESTVLGVHLIDGAVVYYQAQAKFMTFRANVTPILRAFSVTVADGQPYPAAPVTTSVVDELAKLAQLRDAGVLTEEEFSTQKSRFLA
jgi:hypothetical protein